MSESVFISYSRSDRDRIVWIEQNLAVAGLGVFIDRQIGAGSDWETVLRGEIATCECLLVVWTEASVLSDWVSKEVSEALALGKPVVPVRLDTVQPPARFSHLNAADLSKWHGNSNHSEWRKVLACIAPARRSIAEGSAPMVAQLQTTYRDQIAIAENQIDAGSGERVMRVADAERLKSEVAELLRERFEIRQIEDGYALLEKAKSFSWPLAILLGLCLVFPLLVYLRMYKRAPAIERVHIVLVA